MIATRPLRVLVNAINDNAQPRGPDRYLMELLAHMASLPNAPQIHLLHAPWQTFATAMELGPGGRRSEIPAPRAPARRLVWQATRFAALANAAAPDVVFLPNLIWTPGLRQPSVVTAHDLLHFRTPEKFGRRKAALLRPVIRRALGRATRVIAVSDFTATDVVRLTAVPAARLAVIPEGGPRARPRDARAGGGPPVFLFVGKVERTKNVDLLIRSFLGSEALKAAGARLVIAGPDGNASPDIQPLLSLAGDRVLRPGFLPEADLEELYARATAFVFPSIAEGFGLVILEAMARGAPVIAAAATSLPEVVGQAGILVPAGDQIALREAMERLAADPELAARLSTAGYARLGDFCWNRAARETLAVLEAAAEEGRS